jgi:hypothetical protein
MEQPRKIEMSGNEGTRHPIKCFPPFRVSFQNTQRSRQISERKVHMARQVFEWNSAAICIFGVRFGGTFHHHDVNSGGKNPYLPHRKYPIKCILFDTS